ncbi:guanine nucleotide-binding protein-like 3 [Corythoichthys intestinalis]|uniref:guanine nucleotide-binding protein-like 3 n=1 Tax=Corythoichthys intestinalis TaxID=161448 RepID=UPI0025A5D34E|nr:guanine nucleotide-binding protein-like 3 [Corythoichthys intestinalis]
MKRPKLKKASKRVSCALRYKIQKKVREHNRKLKREAKKKGVSKRSKKDPGVPSSAPFKEEVLREAEQRRLQIEEEKERQKQAAKAERAKKRKQEKESASKKEEPKAKKAREVKTVKRPEKENAAEKNTKKFLCAELNKVIDASDVVLEVLDARDPLGCRCPQLEEAVLQRAGNKKLLFVLNKLDLVPRDNAQQWIERLQQEFPVVAFKAATQARHEKTAKRRSRIKPSNQIFDKSRGATCFGGKFLTELLTQIAADKEGDKRLRVGIVGFPNVGKSSLINSLKGSPACIAGLKRGMTKCMQEVQIPPNVNLVDSPGILACPSNPAAAIALRSTQVMDSHESVQEAVWTLLEQCNKQQVLLQFNISDYRNSLEFLNLLAKKHSLFQKGGGLNTMQAASMFLEDWTGAKMSFHCKLTEKCGLPAYVTDAVVTEMWSGLDRAKLTAGNKNTMNNVRFSSQANSISFMSHGPTAGLLVVDDLPEEKGAVKPTNDVVVEAENNEEVKQKEDTNVDESEEVSTEEKTKHVQFKLVPNNISASTVETDDAYDFNAYFK